MSSLWRICFHETSPDYVFGFREFCYCRLLGLGSFRPKAFLLLGAAVELRGPLSCQSVSQIVLPSEQWVRDRRRDLLPFTASLAAFLLELCKEAAMCELGRAEHGSQKCKKGAKFKEDNDRWEVLAQPPAGRWPGSAAPWEPGTPST